MRSTFFYLAMMGTLLSCSERTSEAQEKEVVPNVILIVADDLGYMDLTCYGSEFIETPNLDRLADEGIRFTNGYAAAPLCSPTRASIQTGLYPARIGMTEHIRGHPKPKPWMRVVPVKSVQGLDSAYHTLPELMKAARYTTGHIGKWHLGGGPHLPLAQGYDFNFAGNWAGLPRSFFYPFFDPGVLEEVKSYSKEGDYLTDVLTNRAIEYIEEKKDTSFFLHLAYYSPHVPIEAKKEHVDYYQQKRAPEPDSLLPNVYYAAMIASIDENIGRILKTLDELQLQENTLVIFTSDNGGLSVREVPGYDKHTPPTDNGFLKEGKGYLSEGGIREPFIFRWPAVIAAGQVKATPILSTDFYNTMAAITGQDRRTEDGVNLLPLLEGSGEAEQRNLYWHHPHYSPQRGRPASAMRQGDYKLIYDYETKQTYLYNLDKDPGESENLAEAEPERTSELLNELRDWQNHVRAILPDPNPAYQATER